MSVRREEQPHHGYPHTVPSLCTPHLRVGSLWPTHLPGSTFSVSCCSLVLGGSQGQGVTQELPNWLGKEGVDRMVSLPQLWTSPKHGDCCLRSGGPWGEVGGQGVSLTLSPTSPGQNTSPLPPNTSLS